MKLGLYEERTRITLYLPDSVPAEGKAVQDFKLYLEQLRTKQSGKGRITGYTTTRAFPHPFVGMWWSAKRRQWVREQLSIVVLDHELPISDQRCRDQIDDLKKAAAQSYDNHNRHQEEIWLVAQPIWRND